MIHFAEPNPVKHYLLMVYYRTLFSSARHDRVPTQFRTAKSPTAQCLAMPGRYIQTFAGARRSVSEDLNVVSGLQDRTPLTETASEGGRNAGACACMVLQPKRMAKGETPKSSRVSADRSVP